MKSQRKIYRQDEFTVLETKVPGTQFVGHYLFSRPVNSEFGETQCHYFVSDIGTPFFVWGSSELNFFVAQLEKHEFVSITYVGKEKLNYTPAGSYGTCYIKRFECKPVPQPKKKKGWLR